MTTEWIKKIWRAYMRGAKANYFPISKYGLLGEKLKEPPDDN